MDHSSHVTSTDIDHSGHDMSMFDSTTSSSTSTVMDELANENLFGDDTNQAFCSGSMGMVMFMDGFHWALKRGNQCINLYFPSWTLDSKGKVIGAMIGVLLLAIVTEGISKYRHTLSQKAKKTYYLSQEAKILRLTQTTLHGFHAFTGYILMLATMTFALELLLSVIVGLVIGYAIFGGDQYSHVTTNPCCAFLEDEACERVPSSSNSNCGDDGTNVDGGGGVASAAAAAAVVADDDDGDEETANNKLGNKKDDEQQTMTELNASETSRGDVY